MFIVLEGLDGCGKSTQVIYLKEYLKEKYPNKKVIITREPGGTYCPVSEKIRDIILYNEMDEYTRALLYAASRYEHQLQIKKWLDEGAIVICDRYIYSSLAYQSSLGVPQEEILSINRYKDIVRPDIVFYLRISMDTYTLRKKQRALERDLDVLELRSEEFFLNAMKNFIISNEYIDEYYTEIDANGSIQEVRNNIEKEINNILYI